VQLAFSQSRVEGKRLAMLALAAAGKGHRRLVVEVVVVGEGDQVLAVVVQGVMVE
jgi:hypothetical protein